MFGSLKINGQKLDRVLNLAKAEFGMMIITKKSGSGTWDVGDLLFKANIVGQKLSFIEKPERDFKSNYSIVTNITKGCSWIILNNTDACYEVAYVDMNIDFKKVED